VDQEPRGKAKDWMEGGRIQEGIHDRKSCSYSSKETPRGRRPKFEKEKKIKRKYAERQERERQCTEKMRNGTLEERQRERVYQEELIRNGGMVNDYMERRRWGLID